MKIAIVGRHEQDVLDLMKTHGTFFTLVSEYPDMVFTYGGDGTLMEAEFRFPAVPKLYLKNSKVGKLASQKGNSELLAHVARGEYSIEEHYKLSAQTKQGTLTALNDIIVHNKDPRHAIRYSISIDGVPLGHEVIGDGLVFATPLGSTGYYRSITDSYFEAGIGLAFNNSTEQSDHVVLKENRIVEITITRGPVVCYADNQSEYSTLEAGDTVRVYLSEEKARIVRA